MIPGTAQIQDFEGKGENESFRPSQFRNLSLRVRERSQGRPNFRDLGSKQEEPPGAFSSGSLNVKSSRGAAKASPNSGSLRGRVREGSSGTPRLRIWGTKVRRGSPGAPHSESLKVKA